ncbi:MAG: quinone-dependent dihydroorotate dehydrogenase [Chitinophagaceae bacterium]
MYAGLVKILFLFPPEFAHYFSMNLLRLACRVRFIKKIISRQFQVGSPGFGTQAFGLKFRNPVGLGAGFDKNAKYLAELETLGFGFIEIGTVTPQPQQGNVKPRLFRLVADRALVNRMGFNNDGVKLVAGRLKEWKETKIKRSVFQNHIHADPPAPNKLIIGGNIGKNKLTPNEDAWKDYEICFRELFDCVDYFVVNVSSPNTPGLRELQEKDSLKKILSHLQTINSLQPYPKPLLLKISPDLTVGQLDDVIDLAVEIRLDGLVAANTTISRSGLNTPASIINNIGPGGLSGKPLQQMATAMVDYIHKKSNGAIPIIASGGIFSASDAALRFNAGAALVQVWTGFIYKGPSLIKEIITFVSHPK